MDNAFCLTCETRPTCKEICDPLEAYLKAEQAKTGYSDRHYRRKNFPFDSKLIESLATKRAFELKYGKRYMDRQQRKAKQFME